MQKKLKTVLLTGLSALAILCISSGLVLFSLFGIPFGGLFETVLYLFLSSLALTMAGAAFMCFRAGGRPLVWIGPVPVLLTAAVVAIIVILTIDPRMLYFKSITPNPTKKEWIEDVRYLAQMMNEKHPGLNSLVPEEKMTAVVEELATQIPGMAIPDILMGLFKVAALPNDGHTFPFIMIPAYDLHSFPFKTYLFPEGLYIVDAGREHKDLIGCRILKIGEIPIGDIYKLPLLISAENEQSRRERFNYMVMMAEWLLHHKVIDCIGEATFTFEKRGGERIVRTIQSVRFYQHFMWSSLYRVDNDAPPVFTNYRKDYYRYKALNGGRILYIQFNQCENQPGKKTMDQFAEQLENYAQKTMLERCIVDLRNNDGGSRVWTGLMRFIKSYSKINRPGGLLVLIGRRTFSSAVIFTAELQAQTDAVLLGEPTGQGPIFYGGPDLIELPHSRLPFAISRRKTIAGLPFDGRRAIEPDIYVEYTASDFLTGRDPVLEAALTYVPPKRPTNALSSATLEKYSGRYLLDETEVMDIAYDGKTFRTTITDFIPNSNLRFESVLYPITGGMWDTKTAGVKIEVPAISGGRPERVILNWFGEKRALKRAPKGYMTAFELFSKGDIEAGCEALLTLKEFYKVKYPRIEYLLNNLGYTLLRKQEVAGALKIFRLNVELFPGSYNVFDSYAEALIVDGQRDLAIENYKKSLELNPENVNAQLALKKLNKS
jgi:hypothetical protein